MDDFRRLSNGALASNNNYYNQGSGFGGNNSGFSESNKQVEREYNQFQNQNVDYNNNYYNNNPQVQNGVTKNTSNTVRYNKKSNNNEEDEGRCNRGLKVLSVRVRDIVYQKRKTTYKEVADS